MRKLMLAGLAMVGTFALVAAQPLTASANPTGTNVVISEVQTRAANLDAELANAVELVNPTSGDISLNNWVLRFFDNAGNQTVADLSLTGLTIPADEFIVIKHPDFMPTPIAAGIITRNYTPTSGVDAIPDNGGVELVDETGAKVDLIGMTSGISEGDPAEALDALTDPAGASIQRDVVALDTDDNRDDFNRRVSNWGSLF